MKEKINPVKRKVVKSIPSKRIYHACKGNSIRENVMFNENKDMKGCSGIDNDKKSIL